MCDRATFHGVSFPGRDHAALPKMVKQCNAGARPGYSTIKAHEYEEQSDVLQNKIKFLAQLVAQSSACVAYTGAGISTSSGIDDYATKGQVSDAGPPMNPMDAQPTLAHKALVQLHKEGLLKHWIQQNHDGLPQKAGFPQECLNEIHGAWYDPSNPVVKMNGELRSDLFQWLLEWEQKADLCIAAGTSLSGMNADRIATSVAKRAMQRTQQQEGTTFPFTLCKMKNARSQGTPEMSLGTVIISRQCTPLDEIASLRIFEDIDKVFSLLLEELQIPTVQVHSAGAQSSRCYYRTVTTLNQEFLQHNEHVFVFPQDVGYDSQTGQRLDDTKEFTEDRAGRLEALDLREGSLVSCTAGPYAGCSGEVLGLYGDHFKVILDVPVKGTFRTKWTVRLGLWWVESSLNGSVSSLPLVNALDSP